MVRDNMVQRWLHRERQNSELFAVKNGFFVVWKEIISIPYNTILML